MAYPDELKQLIVNSIAKVQGVVEPVKAKDYKEAFEIGSMVIKEVEAYSSKVSKLSGEEKRQLAIDVLNTLIDVPVLPEFIEAIAIGKLIDVIVSILNRIFGRQWIEKVLW